MQKSRVVLCLLLSAACNPAVSGVGRPDGGFVDDSATRGDARLTDGGIASDGAAGRDAATTRDGAVEPTPLCGRRGRGGQFVNECANGTCEFVCLQRDRCAGVTCASNQTCVDGACIAGCFSWQGIACPAGQRAMVDPSGVRTCVGLDRGECDQCGADEYCKSFCRPRNPCDNVQCAAGSCCGAGGACLTAAQDACCGVTCGQGTICASGVCRGTCTGRVVGSNGETTADADGCNVSCPSSHRCVFGQCQPKPCAPLCPSDGSRANQSDGCGGRCPCVPSCSAPCTPDGCGGTCPAPAPQVCDGANGTLCTPDCSAGACSDNHCHGVCGGCETQCNGTTCCQPTCRANFVDAGQSDGCGGRCPCGPGTSPFPGANIYCCPQDHTRYDFNRPQTGNLCCPPGARYSQPSGGGPAVCCTPQCGPGSEGRDDGCGSVCPCPSGQIFTGNSCCTPTCNGTNACQSNGCGGTCAPPRGSVCNNGTVCTPACGNQNGGTSCGQACPCAPNYVSHNGTCCLPSCTSPCGSNGCGGVCPATASGTVCNNGTVCTPQCATGTCGSDGCGGNCLCPSGATCAQGTCLACPTSCPNGFSLQGCQCVSNGLD